MTKEKKREQAFEKFDAKFPYGKEPGLEAHFNAGYDAGVETMKAENARLRKALKAATLRNADYAFALEKIDQALAE